MYSKITKEYLNRLRSYIEKKKKIQLHCWKSLHNNCPRALSLFNLVKYINIFNILCIPNDIGVLYLCLVDYINIIFKFIKFLITFIAHKNRYKTGICLVISLLQHKHYQSINHKTSLAAIYPNIIFHFVCPSNDFISDSFQKINIFVRLIW